MTREEARQNLIALGIEAPTDAQVTNYLNQFHFNRQQPAPAPNPIPTPAPTPSPEPKPQDNQELEDALNRIKELERENQKKDIAAYATAKGLTGDQVANVLKAFGEDVDAAKGAIDSISQIISDNRTAAAQAKEQELAGKATNPGGGKTGDDVDDKPEDVKNVESIKFGGLSENAQSARNFYK